MQLGLNTFLLSSGFCDAELALVQQFAQYGAEVIELAIADPSMVTPEKLNPVLQENGFSNPIICGAFGPGRDLRGSSQEQVNSIKYLSELIQLSEKVNCNLICGPMYSSGGRTGRHTKDEREAQYDLIAKNLKPLCQQAGDAGVILALEPLNRFETDCINTVSQGLELLNRVDSPHLGLHLDTFHMNIEEENSAEAIKLAGSKVAHFHASASHRGLIGNDQVKWDDIISALKEIHYKGGIVIESFSEDNVTIAKAASIWRSLYKNPEELCVNGIRFLKEKLK